jgi:hypothetical protein
MGEIRKIGDDVFIGIDWAGGKIWYCVVRYDVETGHSGVVAVESVGDPVREIDGVMVPMTQKQTADAIERHVRDQYCREGGSDGCR